MTTATITVLCLIGVIVITSFSVARYNFKRGNPERGQIFITFGIVYTCIWLFLLIFKIALVDS